MTRLRKMMLEELQRRNYAEGTTRYYIRAVQQFAQHFGKSPDKLGPSELRSYQAYLLTASSARLFFDARTNDCRSTAIWRAG